MMSVGQAWMQPLADEAGAERSVPHLDEIFREHAPRVHNLARRMLGNDADAEDATQEVFIQVLRHLPNFRGDAAIATWIHRIAVNAALALRRKRARHEDRELPGTFEDFLDSGDHIWNADPADALLEDEGHCMIERAIAALPQSNRDIFVLSDVEGHSNAEIAEFLQVSVPAVKSRLHRARLTMRRELAPYFENQAA